MNFLSLFSGIEAASVAFPTWTPIAFSEIEKNASKLLTQKYPDTPNLGDITECAEFPKAPVVVGGSPCQSYSVAGKRDSAGYALMLQFLRAVDQVLPRWVIWENVTGVLSSDQGRDFGTLVGTLDELGYDCQWRMLDARFWTPQSRARVFVVGHRRDCGDPPDVLALGKREGIPDAAQEECEIEGLRIRCGANPVIPAITRNYHRGVHAGGEPYIYHGPERWRQLTCEEVERLFGFPTGYTAGFPKTVRYKMLGNTISVPVLRWIGQRIEEIECEQ